MKVSSHNPITSRTDPTTFEHDEPSTKHVHSSTQGPECTIPQRELCCVSLTPTIVTGFGTVPAAVCRHHGTHHRHERVELTLPLLPVFVMMSQDPPFRKQTNSSEEMTRPFHTTKQKIRGSPTMSSRQEDRGPSIHENTQRGDDTVCEQVSSTECATRSTRLLQEKARQDCPRLNCHITHRHACCAGVAQQLDCTRHRGSPRRLSAVTSEHPHTPSRRGLVSAPRDNRRVVFHRFG